MLAFRSNLPRMSYHARYFTRGLVSPLALASNPRTFSSISNDERLQYLSTPPYVLPHHKKIEAPPMVYISGEEMTNYAMSLIVDQWIRPHLDISHWVSSAQLCQDLSCYHDNMSST
jgi:hypothetical protein